MQKKIIALAVAGLVSGAALADTANVTVYGAADFTLDSISATGAAGSGVNLPSRQRINFNSSYLGFKGAESIGSLTAVWQVESGFSGMGGLNTAGQDGKTSIGGRDTMVALAGGFGTVAAGNLTGPTRALGIALDPNVGQTGIGSNAALIGKFGGGTGAGYFDTRLAGAIAYISPAAAGFTGIIGYVPNYNTGTDAAQVTTGLKSTGSGKPGESGYVSAGTACTAGTFDCVATTQAKTSGYNIGVMYANGPISGGLAILNVKDANANAKGSGLKLAVPGVTGTNDGVPLESANNTRFGVKWDFGRGTVGFLYDMSKAKVAAYDEFDVKQTVWYLPVTFNVAEGSKIIFQYGVASDLNIGGDKQKNTGANHLVLGYEYSLSKRTTLKALYSAISNKESASYDFLYGSDATNTGKDSTGFSATGFGAGADPKGISLGLRHTF